MSQSAAENVLAYTAHKPARTDLRWWMLLLLALLACGVYANSLKNGFAYDDLGVIRDNSNVANLEWTRIWKDNYWSTKDGIQPDTLYRPVTLWSYLANQAITPDQPWAFHLVNVLLHGLVTVLVAILAWRILGDRIVAIVAGILFAVHPLHTEVVANTVGRAELLAATWSLLALLVYLPATPLTRETGPTRRPFWHGWLVASCFFAAILSKETPATLLGAIVFIDLWRSLQWKYTWSQRIRYLLAQSWRYYLPLAAFFALYIALRVNGPGLMTETRAIHPLVNPLVNANWVERIFTPFFLLGKYLTLTFWPVHLSADYSAPSISPVGSLKSPGIPGVLLGMLTCALTGLFCVRMWKRVPQFVLLVGLFFFSYFLVSNVIRIGTIFGERLFYWPSVFVLILISWGGVALFRVVRNSTLRAAQPEFEQTDNVLNYASRPLTSYRPNPAAAYIFVPVLALLAAGMSWRTWDRNTAWTDNINLALITAEDNPHSAKACQWAGSVLIIHKEPAHREFAILLLEESIKLYPGMSGGFWELAKHYGREGDIGKSVIYLTHAVRLDPGMHDTYIAMTGVVRDLRRVAPDAYMPTLEKYLAENPEKAEAHLAMALAWHAQGKWELGEAAATEALKFGRTARTDGGNEFHEAAAERARIVFDSGKIDLGLFMYFEYVQRIYRSVNARCEYATMLMAAYQKDAKRFPEALAKAEQRLKEADAIEPGNTQVRDLRGQLNRQRQLGTDNAFATPILPEARQGPVLPATGENP